MLSGLFSIREHTTTLAVVAAEECEWALFGNRLENELQAELHNSRRPGAVNFTVAVVIRLAATRSSGRSRTVATGVNAVPLRMVEGVVGFPAKFYGGVFLSKPRKLKVFQQRHVPIVATWTR